MLLSFIALAVPALDKPIDFRPEIATAPNLIASLAKQTGLRLKTSAPVANDVLAVIAPQKPPREIMDQIALAIEGEWKEDQGEWTLSRSDDTIREQVRRDKEIATEDLKAAIAKIPDHGPLTEKEAAALAGQVEDFRRQPPARNYQEGYEKLRDSMPPQRLLVRFLKRTPAETFASIPFGNRTVFSSAPTRMQRPLPPGMEADIQQYFMESNRLADSWIEPKDGKPPILFNKPSAQIVSKVLVAVYRSSLDGLSIQLIGYNPAGNVAFAASRSFPNDLSEAPTPERLAEGEKIVDLKPESSELLVIARAAIADQAISPSPTLRDSLTRPNDRDPLALINSEALEVLAEVEKKPLVAVIPEAQLQNVVMLAPDGRLTLRRYLQSLAASGAVREDKEGWLCFRESNPALGRIRRVDRRALDGCYRRNERDKRASLDGFADFALKHPTRLEDTLFPVHLMVSGNPKSTYPYADDLSLVRFYGLLDSNQKAAFRAGRELTLTDLNATQVGHISELYYNMRQSSYQYDSLPAFKGFPTNSIQTEPTEANPDGLPPVFSVSAEMTDAPSLFRISLAGQPVPTSPISLAYERFQQERPDIFPGADQMAQSLGNTFVNGQIRKWEFKFRVLPVLTFVSRLHDNEVSPGRKMKYAELPQDVRAEIDRRVAELRFANQGVGNTIKRRGSPPPYN